jgi:hypothetical protein
MSFVSQNVILVTDRTDSTAVRVEISGLPVRRESERSMQAAEGESVRLIRQRKPLDRLLIE